MSFFLSFTEEGNQVFSLENGRCSGLLSGAQVHTHHAALVSKYTNDPAVCIRVTRLPVETVLSAPAISRMTYGQGDNLIRAQLGYLEENEAPSSTEVAMVIMFKDGMIKSHSFLLGGKSWSQVVPLMNLAGCCTSIDTQKSVTVAVDLTAINFGAGRKATSWKRIDELFKDSLSGDVDFSKEHLYVRWRILESQPKDDDTVPAVFLHLEALPLDVSVKNKAAELVEKYNSSSNIAISLFAIPLKWKEPNDQKRLFTTPCIVLADGRSVASDGNIRMSMATIRDVLRRGRVSSGEQENKETVTCPVILSSWGRCPRELYMSEVDTSEIVEKGKYTNCFTSRVVCFGLVGKSGTGEAGFLVAPVLPVLRDKYRVFSRGDKLIFGERRSQVKKYNQSYVVAPQTGRILGPGAPDAYHSIIEEAIAASIAKDTKSGYSTAINMLARCRETLNREMRLPLTNQDVLCFIAFMAGRGVLDSTISKYLSAIRYALLSVGHECNNLRTPVVEQVLKGIRNLKRDPQLAVMKKTRRAMTIDHLRLLGHALAKSNYSDYMKSMMWAGSLAAFWGSVRMGEPMCSLSKEFDPQASLLLSDIKISNGVAKLWIRSPKRCTPTGDVIDVYGVPDKSLDPVVALSYFMEFRRKIHGDSEDLPFFIEQDGKNFTKRKFNRLLHELLDPFLRDNRDSLTGHSFRAGLATLMEVAGFEESEIQAWGRWNSEAFRRYCKEKRPKHLIFQKLYNHLYG